MKILLIVLFAIVMSVPVNAQFQFGIKAGANFCSLTDGLINGEASVNGKKVGYQVGALGAIPIARSFSLQSEVNYSVEGNKAVPNGYAYIITENYINVPVLIKYKRPGGFFAETGPQIGFLLKANISGGPGNGDITTFFKSADLSWAFGLGYFIKAINAGIDARYNIDFTNDLASRTSGGGTNYNSVIQVGVFYLFCRGK